MGSNVGSRMKTGKVTGTGALIKVSIPEFTPRKVQLINVDGLVTLEHNDTMPADSGLKMVQGAPPVFSYITSDGITLVEQLELDDGADPSRGFIIGADADVNAATEVIHWVAYE